MIKRLSLILLLALNASASTVIFDLTNYVSGQSLGTGAVAKVSYVNQATAYGNSLITGPTMTVPVGGSTNLLPGDYSFLIDTLPRGLKWTTPVRFSVPNDSQTYYVSQLVTNLPIASGHAPFVTSIIAGSNVVISPTNGRGNVTISAMGGGSSDAVTNGQASVRIGEINVTNSANVGNLTVQGSAQLDDLRVAGGGNSAGKSINNRWWNTWERMCRMDNNEAVRLNLATLGDSVSGDTASRVAHSLLSRYRKAGYGHIGDGSQGALTGLSMTTNSGSWWTTLYDSTNWPTGVEYVLPPGSIVTVKRSASRVSASVFYFGAVGEPGAATLGVYSLGTELEYPYTKITNYTGGMACDSSVRTGLVFSVQLGTTNQYEWVITNASLTATSRVVAAWAVDETQPGIVLHNLGRGGLDVANSIKCDTNVYVPIVRAMDINLVMLEWKEDVEKVEPGLKWWVNTLSATKPNKYQLDWLVTLNKPQDPQSVMQPAIEWMRRFCSTNDPQLGYIDGQYTLPTWYSMSNYPAGWRSVLNTNDAVHLGWYAQSFVANAAMRDFGFLSSPLKGTVGFQLPAEKFSTVDAVNNIRLAGIRWSESVPTNPVFNYQLDIHPKSESTHSAGTFFDIKGELLVRQMNNDGTFKDLAVFNRGGLGSLATFSHLLPVTNSISYLGDAAHQWLHGWFGTLHTDDLYVRDVRATRYLFGVTGAITNSLTVGGSNVISTAGSAVSGVVITNGVVVAKTYHGNGGTLTNSDGGAAVFQGEPEPLFGSMRLRPVGSEGVDIVLEPKYTGIEITHQTGGSVLLQDGWWSANLGLSAPTVVAGVGGFKGNASAVTNSAGQPPVFQGGNSTNDTVYAGEFFSDVTNATSLATDADGKLIPGTGGGSTDAVTNNQPSVAFGSVSTGNGQASMDSSGYLSGQLLRLQAREFDESTTPTAEPPESMVLLVRTNTGSQRLNVYDATTGLYNELLTGDSGDVATTIHFATTNNDFWHYHTNFITMTNSMVIKTEVLASGPTNDYAAEFRHVFRAGVCLKTNVVYEHDSGATMKALWYGYDGPTFGAIGAAGENVNWTVKIAAVTENHGLVNPPEITFHGVIETNQTDATFAWTTTPATTGVLDLGETTAFELYHFTNNVATTAHTNQATGLTAGTTYHYQVRSAFSGMWTTNSGSFETVAAAAQGVYFYGTNTMTAASFTGQADSERLLISFWWKNDTSQDGASRYPFYTANGKGYFVVQSSEMPRLFWKNDVGTNVLMVTAANDFTGDSAWHHFLISADLGSTATRAVYIDGTPASVTWNAYVTSETFDLTDSGMHVGGANGGSYMKGCLAEVWISGFEPSYYDISVQANREKFRTALGAPANLGADGSAATGTLPLIYLKGGPAQFHINATGRGNFLPRNTFEPCNP
jgi:hypothetical protein